MAMTFDGNFIESDNFHITQIDHYSIPSKDVPIRALAFANKSSIPWSNYPDKGIKVEGYIKCDDTYSLEAYIDILKGYLTAQDAELDIDYNSGTRRYIATVNRTDIKRTDSKKFASFTIDFICSQPFGVETSSTSLVSEANYTSSSNTYSRYIYGTAPYQYPIITITIDALTGTGDYIQISNDNNGQTMLLYGLGLSATDVIVIDTFERTVTLNGATVDYFGTFLELGTGWQSITYTDGFDTRTVDIDIIYYKRYL